jgi:hypothetical protein
VTSTINRPTTETTVHVDPTPAAEPVCQTASPAEPDSGCATPSQQTFTVGTLTIEAADETEALRKYQRMVRAEALKAKVDMDWCDSGTNERLRILGLREVGRGVPMRVTVTATRVAYINIDADDTDEAKQLVAEGGPDVLSMATASIGRQWTVTGIAADNAELIDTSKTRRVDDADDTVAALRQQGELVDGLASCEQYNRGSGYYCTMPAGHVGQHAAGNGRRIVSVWNPA